MYDCTRPRSGGQALFTSISNLLDERRQRWKAHHPQAKQLADNDRKLLDHYLARGNKRTGQSYWSDRRTSTEIGLTECQIAESRRSLIDLGLVRIVGRTAGGNLVMEVDGWREIWIAAVAEAR